MEALRLVLADARPVRRHRLGTLIAAQPDLDLVASCARLMDAYSNVETQVPDLVLSCAALRKDPAYAMFAAMMQTLGIADVALDALLAENPSNAQFLVALRTRKALPGAAEAWQGPAPGLLRGPVLSLPLPVHRRPAGPGPTSAQAPVQAPARTQTRSQAQAATGSGIASLPGGLPPIAEPRPGRRGTVIVIGASTGGVEALHRLLSRLPADCPPVLVVQHIRGDFAASFAARLNRACLAEVTVARHLAPLQRGQILIAPGSETHLVIGRAAAGERELHCELEAGDKVSGHRPSVDRLFLSAAPLGPHAIGILLTGMGQDGAQGLLAMQRSGAETIAQDRDTSVVYGMPRIAAELGAARLILPLDLIAEAALNAACVTHGRAPRPAPVGSGQETRR